MSGWKNGDEAQKKVTEAVIDKAYEISEEVLNLITIRCSEEGLESPHMQTTILGMAFCKVAAIVTMLLPAEDRENYAKIVFEGLKKPYAAEVEFARRKIKDMFGGLK